MPYKNKKLEKEKKKANYRKLVSVGGICPQCKGEWNGTQVKCDKCREQDKEARKARREKWEKEGLCNRCGKKFHMVGVKYCMDCCLKSKKYKASQEAVQNKLSRYHSELKEGLKQQRQTYKQLGLCADCGKRKASIGVVCKECYAKRRKVYEKAKLRAWAEEEAEVEEIELTRQELIESEYRDRVSLRINNKWTDAQEIKNLTKRYNTALKVINSLKEKEVTCKVGNKLDKAQVTVEVCILRLKALGVELESTA